METSNVGRPVAAPEDVIKNLPRTVLESDCEQSLRSILDIVTEGYFSQHRYFLKTAQYAKTPFRWTRKTRMNRSSLHCRVNMHSTKPVSYPGLRIVGHVPYAGTTIRFMIEACGLQLHRRYALVPQPEAHGPPTPAQAGGSGNNSGNAPRGPAGFFSSLLGGSGRSHGSGSQRNRGGPDSSDSPPGGWHDEGLD